MATSEGYPWLKCAAPMIRQQRLDQMPVSLEGYSTLAVRGMGGYNYKQGANYSSQWGEGNRFLSFAYQGMVLRMGLRNMCKIQQPQRQQVIAESGSCSIFRDMTAFFLLRQVLSQGGIWRIDRDFFIKSACYSLTWKVKAVRKQGSLSRLRVPPGSLIPLLPHSTSSVPGPLHLSWVAESTLQFPDSRGMVPKCKHNVSKTIIQTLFQEQALNFRVVSF